VKGPGRATGRAYPILADSEEEGHHQPGAEYASGKKKAKKRKENPMKKS